MKRAKNIFALFLASFLLIGAGSALAATYDLPNISCPTGINCPIISDAAAAADPGAYIARFYQIALAIAGVLAVGIIVTGSLFYTFAGGSTDRQQTGKSMITSALWGIALLFGSYLILNTVNPELIVLDLKRGASVTVTPADFAPELRYCSIATISGINCNDSRVVDSEPYDGDAEDCQTAAQKKFIERLQECNNQFPGGGGFAYNSGRGASSCHPFYKTYTPEVKKPFNPLLDDSQTSPVWPKKEWKFC